MALMLEQVLELELGAFDISHDQSPGLDEAVASPAVSAMEAAQQRGGERKDWSDMQGHRVHHSKAQQQQQQHHPGGHLQQQLPGKPTVEHSAADHTGLWSAHGDHDSVAGNGAPWLSTAHGSNAHSPQEHLRALRAARPASTVEINTTIAPMRKDIEAKALKPNCTECIGCTVPVKPLMSQTAFGRNFTVETGASPEWLFTADIPEAPGRRAVIKVWCVPFDKHGLNFRWMCTNTQEAVRATSFLLAQQRLMDDCGLLDVTIKLWLGPVNAVVPGIGFHIWWDGLWMQMAQGVSLNQLAYMTKQQMQRGNLLDMLQHKVNKTKIVRSAIFDLITSQCDRHSQNVFLSETGDLTLIDNLQALKYSWLKCSADSIFLPGTTKNEIIRFGGDLVNKYKGANQRKSLNPVLLLDYRCYVENGLIGTNYPPQVSQCLNTLRGMTPAEIQAKYAFPNLRNAEMVHSRATDMMTKGFEWTLKYGQPLNPAPKRYRWQPPCCEMHIDDMGALKCSHEWNVLLEFPVGDPVEGGAWSRPYPDPGAYNGADI